ncbi:zinc finger CCCH domain-containing protein 6-like isoform X1 [Nicotiana tabacum]|uniref:Zinc finger CCCH domain-containing protein 6-like isoform X1 n=1 Tax=Nicotiana tabacum TaxID=4097 RepID=A0A1S4A2E4_TOBAC|nr:PREDICTED: zinc finger CCCH domain-containing protein 6-like isoform X1 [Nicotiana tabacum]
MRGQQKSKRVTWASDVNLCQVRLFLSEDSPAQVGLGAQDHLQAKISWPLHAGVLVSDDNLPPGFEGAQPASLWKNKLAQIPVIKWTRPPSFVLATKWRVVAGEESNEMEVQKQREMRVLEAIYPRESSIPPNPSMVPGEETLHNEQNTPVIPITPVEEEEVADPSFGTVLPSNAVSSKAQVMQSGVLLSNKSAGNNLPVPGISSAGVVPGVEPDVVAAAQAALTALMADNGQGNLIDHELLIKILSDPKIVGQLVTQQGAGTSSHSVPPTSTQNMSAASNMPNPRPQASSISAPPQAVVSRADPSLVHTGRADTPAVPVSRTELVMPSVAGASNGPFHSAPSRIGPIPSLRPRVPEVVSAPLPSVGAPVASVSTPSSSMPVPVARDINYYKSLIQQHGGERQETLPQYSNRNNQHLGSVQESINSSNHRDSKPKIMKPCIYFNSSKGCRHGVNCAYLHDASSQQRVGSLPEVQNSKRMKMDREITGT